MSMILQIDNVNDITNTDCQWYYKYRMSLILQIGNFTCNDITKK